MSFWGATVITSLVTAVPIIGQTVVDWLWGGFTINNATLNRFFSLHFFLPFIIAGFSIIHLALLHKSGSNNPLGINSKNDKIPFFPYFFIKDLFAFYCYLSFFCFLIFYYPNFLGHSDNYIPANPMQTPAHIIPEWYFLPFYAILRSIPDKLGGVIAMGGSLIILFFLPFLNTSEIRNTYFRIFFKFFYWLFIGNFFILGWIGQKPVKDTFVFVGQLATMYYFLFFLIVIPVIGLIETKLAVIKIKNFMFTVKLYSITYTILQIFIQFLVAISQNKKIKLFNTYKTLNNVKNKKIFTLLKSPHVNKTAQEQFKLPYFTGSFFIVCSAKKRVLYVLKKIKSILFSSLIIKLSLWFFPNNCSNKTLNINGFQIEYFCELSAKTLNHFFRLANYFGFYIFKTLHF